MTTLLVGRWLLVHVVQVAILTTIAALAAAITGLPPRWGRLAYWRCVLVLSLLLPWIALAPTAGGAPMAVAAAASFGTAVAQTSEYLGAAALQLIVFSVLLGIAVRLAWLTVGYTRLKSQLGNTISVSPGSSLDVMRAALAPRASIGLVTGLEQPVTFGWRHPQVLLPDRLLMVSDREQRSVVCHELLHVARRDWLWVLLEEGIRTVFWFNPGIRHALTQLQLGREEAVDAAVVSLTGCRREYMQALLRFAAHPDGNLEGLTFGSNRHLRVRMKALSEGGSMTRTRTAVTMTVLLVGMAGAAMVVAASPLRTPDAQTYAPGNGVSLPVVVKEVRPSYPDAAKQAKVVGTVLLDCVVRPDGKPSNITVTRSLDTAYGLDSEAVKALEQWRFRPGQRNGKPVAVKISIEMTFTLR